LEIRRFVEKPWKSSFAGILYVKIWGCTLSLLSTSKAVTLNHKKRDALPSNIKKKYPTVKRAFPSSQYTRFIHRFTCISTDTWNANDPCFGFEKALFWAVDLQK